MQNFHNELQGLAMDPYQVGEVVSYAPQFQDERLWGRCGGFRCGGFHRCGGFGFRCGGCFGCGGCGGCGGCFGGFGCVGIGFGCFGFGIGFI